MTKDTVIAGLSSRAEYSTDALNKELYLAAITLIEQQAREIEAWRIGFDNLQANSEQEIKDLLAEVDDLKTQLSLVTAERDKLRQCAKECFSQWKGQSIPTCFLPLALLLDHGV